MNNQTTQHSWHGRWLPISWLTIFLLLGLFLAACEEEEPEPAPTVASFFSSPTPRPTVTPRPTSTLAPTLTPSPIPVFDTITIYDDALAPGWTVENSRLTFVDTESTEHVFMGERAIQIFPRHETARFFLTKLETDSDPIRQEDIFSIRFYISGASSPIAPDDFGIAQQGSNEWTYWVENDSSARLETGVSFQETILFFFDIQNTIPENTWEIIEIFPDQLQFDPPYNYFNGIYIKSAPDFLMPYYIDQIEIVTISQ